MLADRQHFSSAYNRLRSHSPGGDNPSGGHNRIQPKPASIMCPAGITIPQSAGLLTQTGMLLPGKAYWVTICLPTAVTIQSIYNFNPPRAGKPHSASVGNSTPKGTKAAAYAHTHPDSNVFSGADIRAAQSLNIDAYVVGPNLELQRYSLASASATNLGVISPVALTDAQRSALITEFQVSWDTHISSGCDFGCGSMTWPTP